MEKGVRQGTESDSESTKEVGNEQIHLPMVDSEKSSAVASAAQPKVAADPPDGGLTAWLQVLGSWMMIFNTWGTIITFGDYQAYYATSASFLSHTSSSTVSWIGSIQSLLVFATGALVGPVYDRGYLRFLLLTGGFGIVFGHMMLSICDRYWQALLAQGVVVGLGGGCLFVPALAILQPYFKKRLGLAVGVAATGSSMGGVIYPIIFTNMIDRVGFGWTVRTIGFVALGTLMIPICISKMRARPPAVRKLLDLDAFTDWPFMVSVLGTFFGMTGMYVAFFYTSYFSQARGFMSDNMALYLVPILNGASTFGRVLPNWLSDQIGPVNVIIPGSFSIGVILLCNLAVHNSAGAILTALFFGFFSGMFIATPPLLFVAFTKDKSKLGTRMGMAYAMLGLSVLPGGPGSGGVLQHRAGELDWTAAWTYAGVLPLVAGIVFIGLRFRVGGRKMKVKV